MADISTELNEIKTNQYGETVVTSIADAATAINEELEAAKLTIDARIEDFVEWLEGG